MTENAPLFVVFSSISVHCREKPFFPPPGGEDFPVFPGFCPESRPCRCYSKNSRFSRIFPDRRSGSKAVFCPDPTGSAGSRRRSGCLRQGWETSCFFPGAYAETGTDPVPDYPEDSECKRSAHPKRVPDAVHLSDLCRNRIRDSKFLGMYCLYADSHVLSDWKEKQRKLK